MNWLLPAAWIYEGNLPDLAKADRYGIKVIYVDSRNANAHQAIDAIRGHGLTAGAYFADSWSSALSAGQFADQISSVLNRVLPKGTLPEAPPVMLDVEGHDGAWASALLERLYEHQPHRPTSYTVMPFQGGNTPYTTLTRHGVHLYVQLYHDEPSKTMVANDPAAVILEAARQMPASFVHPFYDGARWGSDHRDGCYFTLERMP